MTLTWKEETTAQLLFGSRCGDINANADSTGGKCNVKGRKDPRNVSTQN